MIDDAPKLDIELSYIWRLYWDIKRGADNVDIQTIAAWQQISGVKFNSFEVDSLIEIDLQRRHTA